MTGLDRDAEKALIAETAMEYARFELEKLSQHLIDILKFGDEGLAMQTAALPNHVCQVIAWVTIYRHYTGPSDVATIPQPIPDQGQ
jgi:hypothetical protein